MLKEYGQKEPHGYNIHRQEPNRSTSYLPMCLKIKVIWNHIDTIGID